MFPAPIDRETRAAPEFHKWCFILWGELTLTDGAPVTYYPDLSAYDYSPDQGDLINVGWLGVGHEFPTGDVSTDIRNSLIELAYESRNVMRGFHYCEFCDEESPITVEGSTSDGHYFRTFLGTGEIRIHTASGRAYAAPTLLVHYIDAHQYLPPAEFIAAVAVPKDQRPAEPIVVSAEFRSAAARILAGDDTKAAANELEGIVIKDYLDEDRADDLLFALAMYAPGEGPEYFEAPELRKVIEQTLKVFADAEEIENQT